MVPPAIGVRSRILDGDEIRLELNNTIQAVEDGRQELLGFFADHALSPRTVRDFELVFEELVSNVIRHGFEPGSDQSIRVTCRTDGSAIRLTIEDDGSPFNPLAAAEPARLESLATARLGGLGVPLVRKLASALEYEPGPAPPPAGAAFAPVNRLKVTIPVAA